MFERAFVALLGGALALYAVLGGADFGGGILDLTARGPLAERQRRAIAVVMGPVWEANHVWLIFALTLGFTAFPRAFAVASEALYLPFGLALLGIVLRGAAFAFRAYGAGARGFRRVPGHVFGAASLITPLSLGAAAGALAAGRVRVGPDGHAVASVGAWTGPLSLACAALAAAACAYLAAAYMAVEARRAGERHLEEAFRRRALAAGLAVSLLAPAGLAAARFAAPVVWPGLFGRALPLLAGSGAAGLASLAALARRRYGAARALAAVAVAAVLGAWTVAQWPWLVVPDVTVDSAAPAPVLRAALIALAAGAALLLPSLALLYRLFGSSRSRPLF